MSTKAPSVKPGSLGAILRSLSAIYDRRWLIKYLVQRQLASSYRHSYLGLVWAFLGPLMLVICLALIFSEMIGIRFREVTGDSALNFGLFLYCGLLPFLAYSQAVTTGVNIIRRNSELVTKVIFPLEILPMVAVITSLLQNALGLGALILVLVVIEQRLSLTAFLLPLVLVPQVLFTLGLCYLMAVAGTYVPDIRETLRIIIRATFFITPILWPVGRVPEAWQFLVNYNPLAVLVEGYRNLLLDGKLPGSIGLLYLSLFAVALFAAGFVLFNRVKHKFADLL